MGTEDNAFVVMKITALFFEKISGTSKNTNIHIKILLSIIIIFNNKDRSARKYLGLR